MKEHKGFKKIDFTFEGNSYEAKKGDSIAAALTSNNIKIFRSTESNTNRGIYCGMGVCHECQVEVDEASGVLACMQQMSHGMNVAIQKQHRKINTSVNVLQKKELKVHSDVLIIGAGPAGLSLAKKLSKSGLSVAIVDERKNPGGQYFKQPAPEFDLNFESLDSQFHEGRVLIDKIRRSQVKIYSGVSVWGVFGYDYLLGSDEKNRFVFNQKELVLATGAYEKGLLLAGWTLPGVMTTGAAQTLLRSYQVAPGKKVFVAGNGPLNLQIAAELTKSGTDVVGYAESANLFTLKRILLSIILGILAPRIGVRGLGYFLTLKRKSIPVFTSHIPTNIVGEGQIEAVKIAKVSKNKIIDKNRVHQFNVDALTLGFGFYSANEIAQNLGCNHKIDPNLGLKTITTLFGRSSKPHVWVVGDSAGINGAQVAKSRGKLMAFKIKNQLVNKSTKIIFKELLELPLIALTILNLNRHLLFQNLLWRIFDAPTFLDELASDETIVCRCMNLTHKDIKSQISSDVFTADAVKRITRAGMGKCQGRYCSVIVQHLVAKHSGEMVNEFSSFKVQVPIKPVTIGDIAHSDDSEFL